MGNYTDKTCIREVGMLPGAKLHDFHVELMGYLRFNVCEACHDQRFRRALDDALPDAFLDYLLSEDVSDDRSPEERLLPTDRDLLELAEFTATERCTSQWEAYPQLHGRSAYCITEIREFLT